MSKSLKPATEYIKAALQTTEKLNKKGANLFDLLSRSPRNGVDLCFKRKTWKFDSYYKIAKVTLSADGKHGSAWGVFYYNGKPSKEEPEKIHGALKKDLWKGINDVQLQQYETNRLESEYNNWILESAMKQNEEALSQQK